MVRFIIVCDIASSVDVACFNIEHTKKQSLAYLSLIFYSQKSILSLIETYPPPEFTILSYFFRISGRLNEVKVPLLFLFSPLIHSFCLTVVKFASRFGIIFGVTMDKFVLETFLSEFSLRWTCIVCCNFFSFHYHQYHIRLSRSSGYRPLHLFERSPVRKSTECSALLAEIFSGFYCDFAVRCIQIGHDRHLIPWCYNPLFIIIPENVSWFSIVM
jgi:hypothetical protein